ncbi:YcxB family protein [Streptomyces sp. NPDC006326]|uniref:YcxB family protein n=1 Tax=Streptomyces sp. NPDC006326 TaxID=3156752 RepID=UPI0033A6C140
MHKGGDHIQQDGRGTATAITFVYEPTPQDYKAAVRRFQIGTWPGRRGLLLMLALGPALGLAISKLKGFSPLATDFVLVSVALASLVIIPRTLTRLGREQYEDMEAYGTCRTVVGEDGLTTTGGDLSSSIEWHAFPWYFETDELFVLTTRRTRMYFALPKRGAQDPADVDRVRAVLDRNLRRL